MILTIKEPKDIEKENDAAERKAAREAALEQAKKIEEELYQDVDYVVKEVAKSERTMKVKDMYLWRFMKIFKRFPTEKEHLAYIKMHVMPTKKDCDSLKEIRRKWKKTITKK